MTRAQTSARATSLILLAVFLAIYSSCAEVSALRCNRDDCTCRHTQTRLFKTGETTIRVQDLHAAYEETNARSGRGSRTGRTMLDTRQGQIQFEVWGNSRLGDVSADVNHFVKRPDQRTLDAAHDTRSSVFWSSSFLLVAAVILFAMSFATSLTTR